MLDDRHYMRPDYQPRGSFNLRMTASIGLMISLVVAYLLQHTGHYPVNDYFALSLEGLRRGYVWQLLTFQFLHAGPEHLIGNLIALWAFARPVEDRLGKSRLLLIYFLSGVTGGLLQTLCMWLFHGHFASVVVGASAGIFGLVAAFALMDPDASILLYFVFPIRAKYFLYGATAIALFFTLKPSAGGQIAHAAHLGGIIFAVAYMKWGLNAQRPWSEWNPLQRKMRRERMMKAAAISQPLGKLRRRPAVEEASDLPSEEFISKQVDPILDKISAHGIQSLTDRERRVLQAARAKMSKR